MESESSIYYQNNFFTAIGKKGSLDFDWLLAFICAACKYGHRKCLLYVSLNEYLSYPASSENKVLNELFIKTNWCDHCQI